MADDRGTVTISKFAMTELAREVALSCDGIYDLCSRSRYDELIYRLNTTRSVRGVCCRSVAGIACFDIYAYIRYGASADSISQYIRNKFSDIGIKADVNIHVMGVKEG